MKTDKISFGTKPLIGDFSARVGLPKYKKTLTDGIFDAFQQLTKNNVDDELALSFGIKPVSKSTYCDVLDLSYFKKEDGDKTGMFFKSSIGFSLASLENLSRKNITKLILQSYELLTQSKAKSGVISAIPIQKSEIKISQAHKDSIDKLLNEFSYDDSSSLV